MTSPARRSRTRRGGLIFPLVIVTVGVVLLLTNLGVVSSSVWGQLVRFWPVLLIALGFDILVGRPSIGSAISTLIATCLLVALALAAITLFGPEAWVTRQQSFAHPLGSATAAKVDLACDGCAIALSGTAAPANLIEGTVSVRRDERLAQVGERTGETILFELTGDPILPSFRTAARGERPWELRLHAGVPIDLTVSTDGTIDLDLRALRIASADVSAERETCTIVLPENGRTTAHVSADNLLVRIPDGVGVRVIGTPTGDLDLPNGYVGSPGDLHSPDYAEAEATTDLYLRPGAGDVEIVPLDVGPVGEVDAT